MPPIVVSRLGLDVDLTVKEALLNVGEVDEDSFDHERLSGISQVGPGQILIELPEGGRERQVEQA
jgi:hypothetical protein